MLARIHKSMKEREEGFTLIELLVVVIIIGILAAIAIPVFLSQRNKAHDAAAQSDLKSLATAEEAYLTEPGVTGYVTDNSAQTNTSLSAEGFKPTTGVLTAVKADGSKGYCAIAKSTSGKYFFYDSMAGGLQSFSSTTAPGAADAPANGACADTATGGYPTAP